MNWSAKGQARSATSHEPNASKRDCIVPYLAWGYLGCVVALELIAFLGGDRWWFATVVLYSPRWLAAIPLVILLPLATYSHCRSLIPLFLGALIVFGPFMGFRLGLGKTHTPVKSGSPVIRVLTCNIDNGSFSKKALSMLIRESRADIVALQECSGEIKLEMPPGWNGIREGGHGIFSRYPLDRCQTVPVFRPPEKWPMICMLQCIVQAPGGEVAFGSIQLPTPRPGLQAMLDRRMILNPWRRGELEKLTEYRWRASREVRQAVDLISYPVIIAGDFNMPTDSAIFRDVWGKYADAFSVAGFGYGLTQRASYKQITIGARIDHVLAGEGLVPLVCETGPDVGSDHLPLIADIGRKR